MFLTLSQKIREELLKENVKLISQIEVSEDEYIDMLTYVRKYLKVDIRNIDKYIPIDETVATFLVQVAIKRYSDGNYWDYFIDEIGFDLNSNIKRILGKIFIETIRYFNLFELEQKDENRFAYVENIKAHAFVPNKYFGRYFDFLYSFYDRNLLRNLSADIDEDIDDLIKFFNKGLKNNDENISISDEGSRPSKTYCLIKATQLAIAKCDAKIVSDLIHSQLIMLDEYYYDSKIPENSTRISECFLEWIDSNESEINLDLTRAANKRNRYFQRPYIELDRNNEKVYLVIPQQKFRDISFENLQLTIQGHDKKIVDMLEAYRAYGVIVSEKKTIEIPSLFASYVITIGDDIKKFTIKDKSYRIFNEDFKEIEKLKKGQNYLFVEPETIVTGQHRPLYINDSYSNWCEYSFSNINESSIIYVNDSPISIYGEFANKPIFENVSKEYYLMHDGKNIQTAYKHPIVSFEVFSNSFEGTFLWCNTDKYHIASFTNMAKVELPNGKLGITLDLESILADNDDVYIITLDEPGRAKKTVCKYVLISTLRFQHGRRRYRFADKAIIKTVGDYDLTPINCNINNENEYEVLLTPNTDAAEFVLKFSDEEFNLFVPINIFKFGFEEDWNIIPEEYVWYEDIKNDFYISMPGATESSLDLYRDDRDNKSFLASCTGEQTDENIFRFDLSNFKNRIENSKADSLVIKLSYCDTKQHNFMLLRIQRRISVEHFNLYATDEGIFFNISYKGKPSLVIKFFDYYTKELIIRKELVNGTNAFNELTLQGLYYFELYSLVSDEFGFGDIEKKLGDVKKIGVINSKDFSNCKMIIKKITNCGKNVPYNFEFSVFDLQKVKENIYTGKMMYRAGKFSKGVYMPKYATLFEKVQFEIFIEGSHINILNLFVVSDEECYTPYFDKKTKNLLSENSSVLLSTNDYSRFLPLYEDETEIFVNFRRTR